MSELKRYIYFASGGCGSSSVEVILMDNNTFKLNYHDGWMGDKDKTFHLVGAYQKITDNYYYLVILHGQSLAFDLYTFDKVCEYTTLDNHIVDMDMLMTISKFDAILLMNNYSTFVEEGESVKNHKRLKFMKLLNFDDADKNTVSDLKGLSEVHFNDKLYNDSLDKLLELSKILEYDDMFAIYGNDDDDKRNTRKKFAELTKVEELEDI